MKKFLFILVVSLAVSLISKAQLYQVFQKNNKAVDGYDVVAFFKSGTANKGHDSLTYTWNNATWSFISQANIDSFKTNPEKYAPQYGGFCAYGCSNGYKAPTEIDTWTIVNNKLYFNYNQKVKENWLKNREALIIKADEHWELIKNKE